MKSYSAPESEKTGHYLEKTFAPEDAVLAEIRERSHAKRLPGIQVGPMDALHLEVLVRMSGAKKAVEIGTLGGYSGTAIARAIGETGRLYTFEYEAKHAAVARESFEKAGVASRVELFQGPAIENLPRINSKGPFDLVFIDADKENYPNYLTWAAEHLRIGGTVIGDNTLAWGMIDDQDFSSAEEEKRVRGLQRFNFELARGGRFRSTLLPTGEGLTVGVKVR